MDQALSERLSAVVRSGCLQSRDLARLLQVHRCTASGWINGRAAPHPLLKGKVESVLDALEAAVKVGRLPVPPEITRRERGLYIENALRKA